MRGICTYCNKAIIQDVFKFFKDNESKKEKVIEIECPYCGNIEEVYL